MSTGRCGQVAEVPGVPEELVIRVTQDLVRIPTVNPPGGEEKACDYLVSLLHGLGVEAAVDPVAPGRANVVARLTGQVPGPTLLLNGHLDVVPPGDEPWTHDPFAGQLVGDRIWGRGTADAKGGIAAMVGALAAIRGSGGLRRGTLLFLAVADEEYGQSGARRAVECGLRADAAIVAEPTGLLPVVAHRGSLLMEVQTFGRSAHGSTPETGVNAVVHMCRVVADLARLQGELRVRRHPLVGSAALNVSFIQGGSSAWSVPAHCRILVDRRTLPGETEADVLGEVQEILRHQADLDAQFHGELQVLASCPALELDPAHPLAAAVRTAVALETGRDPGVGGMPATTDAAIFAAAGIPALVCGPGLLEVCHRPDEWVSVADLLAAARVYVRAIRAFLER